MGTDEALPLYFKLGWRAIPIRGKIPYIQNWQLTHLTECEFNAQFRAGDNVGIITGWIKDKIGLCALDVDQPNLVGFKFEPWIAKGAMAHTTSTGPRLVFYADSQEVLGFSRKVTITRDQLSEEERSRLNWKAEGKETITVLEVLAQGRQFMAPPSHHPDTGEVLAWTNPPKPPEEALTIHSLDELKVLMEKSITRSRWVLEELFETSKVEAQYDTKLLSNWLEKIRGQLQPAGETGNYFLFHCSFHPPDKRPSFVIHKTKFYAFDYHDDQVYSLKALAKKLGVNLLGVDVGKDEPTILDHLNMIEDPGLAGKHLIVEAVVSSTSVAYLAPKKVEVHIQRGDGDATELNETFTTDDPINIKLVGVNEDVKYRRLKRLFGESGNARVKEKTWRTIYLVRVRPPIFTLEKRGESIVDERGFEYKAFDVYVVADQPLTFQASALVKLEAKPLGSPKTQKTVLLATRVEFPEETWRFDEAKLRKLKAKLGSYGSVKEKLNWILAEFQKFSGLVGRRNLAYAGFLAFFSPVWVVLDGETQRGWAVVLFIGDTTTGKSETLRKLIMLLKGGMLVTAETASQVGLTGTATQLEKEGWFVDWGFLVLCDRKLLAIDGVHKLPPSCWAALAEAERAGVVTIAKAAKNSAYARTRQIKIGNPMDREAEKWTTKPLADFLYPCQALPTLLDKTGIARLDLAVFADSRDVKAEDVNIQMNGHPDPDLELLSEALRWCWSGTVKVEFTDGAIAQILKSATELYNTFYTRSIPLVSMDMKWKLARLSAALAYLTLFTEDFTKVRVDPEHVREVATFLKEEYGKAGLSSLAQEERYEVYTSEDVERIILATSALVNMDRDTLEVILKFIVLQGRVTRDQLRTKFNLAENNQLRPLLALLKNENLIRAGRGFYPTPQLIQLYKVLTVSRLSSLTRSEKDPPENSGDKDDDNDR